MRVRYKESACYWCGQKTKIVWTTIGNGREMSSGRLNGDGSRHRCPKMRALRQEWDHSLPSHDDASLPDSDHESGE